MSRDLEPISVAHSSHYRQIRHHDLSVTIDTVKAWFASAAIMIGLAPAWLPSQVQLDLSSPATRPQHSALIRGFAGFRGSDGSPP